MNVTEKYNLDEHYEMINKISLHPPRFALDMPVKSSASILHDEYT